MTSGTERAERDLAAQPDLTVLILNWNTRELLAACLESVAPSMAAGRIQVVVADNASEDESAAMVRERFPGVVLVEHPHNLGFGAGNNRALPAASGRYVLFLNSDTVVHAGALEALIDFGDRSPDAGIIGPRLENADGSLQYSCRHYPTLAAGFFRNTPLGRLLPGNRAVADYVMSNADHTRPMDVDWVSGAALMMRRSLIDEIGAFDEDYYMYCEDVDLCWRVNHAPRDDGTPWRVRYFPGAVITHYIGRSSDFVPTRMTYEFHRSQYLFYKKHYAAAYPWWIRPIIPVGIALRAVGKLVRYKIHSMLVVARRRREGR